MQASTEGCCCCPLPAPACSCLLLPAAAACFCCLLPAACYLLLPSACCCCLLLLLLPAVAVACCCCCCLLLMLLLLLLLRCDSCRKGWRSTKKAPQRKKIKLPLARCSMICKNSVPTLGGKRRKSKRLARDVLHFPKFCNTSRLKVRFPARCSEKYLEKPTKTRKTRPEATQISRKC